LIIPLKMIGIALVNLVALGSSQHEAAIDALPLEEKPETGRRMAMAVEKTFATISQQLGVSALHSGCREVLR